MRLDARLAGQWTPAELGVHLVAGGANLVPNGRERSGVLAIGGGIASS
jgi:hypothetical protein